jgi:menaquinone-dependent protoporphyrinogen IX oxidase
MSNGKNLLIIYAGHYGTDVKQHQKGSIATIAEWISQGASQTLGTKVTVMRARDIKDVSQINAADGYVLGSGVYNGNPEPEFINFVDTILLAGKADDPNKPQIANKPFGVFCTSAGYVTGAQPVLNAMARAFMTFNAVYIGGSRWDTGQGLCGMVKDNNTIPPSWDWDPHSAEYIKDDAMDYGKLLAVVTSFFNSSFTTASKQPPSQGKTITCPSTQQSHCCVIKRTCGNKRVILLLSFAVLIMVIIFFAIVINKRN